MGSRAHVGHALRACRPARTADPAQCCHREERSDDAIPWNSAGFRHAPRMTQGARGFGGGPPQAGLAMTKRAERRLSGVEAHDRGVEGGGEAHPGEVGDQQQRRDALEPPPPNDERENRGPQDHD